MRDYERHPEPTSPDLGVLCLRAVTIDGRFNDRVRKQAERLLKLSDLRDGAHRHLSIVPAAA